MPLTFFISHSHRDERIASALVTFLTNGVGVERKDIRCTSQLGTGLESGTVIDKQLLSDIKKCEYFVPLITENSNTSEFVAFEIGAAWALQKQHIVPLVFASSRALSVPSLLRQFLYRDITRLENLIELAHELTSAIFYKADRTTTQDILQAANTFLSHVSGRGDR